MDMLSLRNYKASPSNVNLVSSHMHMRATSTQRSRMLGTWTQSVCIDLQRSSNLVLCPAVITVELVVRAVDFAVPFCRIFSKTLLPSVSHKNVTIRPSTQTIRKNIKRKSSPNSTSFESICMKKIPQHGTCHRSRPCSSCIVSYRMSS